MKPTNERPTEQIPSLTLVGGSGAVYPIEKPVTTIGSGPENDIVLTQSGVSRRHASIRQGAGGFLIEDHGSTNGVRVNGSKVATAPLGGGETIELGDARLLFSTRKGAATSASPGSPAALRIVIGALAAAIALIVAVAALLPGGPNRAEEDGKILAGARKAAEAKKWKDAREALERIAKEGPAFKEAQGLLSKIAEEEKNEQDFRKVQELLGAGAFADAAALAERIPAASAYREAARREVEMERRKVGDTNLREVEKLLGQGRVPNARELLDRTARFDPQNPRLFELQGRVAKAEAPSPVSPKSLAQAEQHVKGERYAEAREELQRVKAEAGKGPEAPAVLAAAQQLLDRIAREEKGQEEFRKGEELLKDSEKGAQARAVLLAVPEGTLYFEKAKDALAKKESEVARRAREAFDPFRKEYTAAGNPSLEQLQAWTEKFEDARDAALWAKYLGEPGGAGDVLLSEIEALRKKVSGDLTDAMQARSAIERLRDAYKAAVAIYVGGETDKAVDGLQDILDHKYAYKYQPEPSIGKTAEEAKAAIKEIAKEFDRAKAHFDRGVKTEALDAFDRVRVLDQKVRGKEGVSYYVLKANERMVEMYLETLETQLKSSNYPEVKVFWEKAAAIAPENKRLGEVKEILIKEAETWYTRGKEGPPTRSREYFEHGLSIAPADTTVHDNLKREMSYLR